MTQHILTINNYLQSPISALVNLFRKIGNAFVESRMKTAMKVVKQQLMTHRAYRETYNELAQMSDRELRDIGLNRSMIHSVAYEAAYGSQD